MFDDVSVPLKTCGRLYKELKAKVLDAETVKLIELTRVVPYVASLSRDVKKLGSVSV